MTKKISLLLAIIMAFCSCIALSSCGETPVEEENNNGGGEDEKTSYVFDYHISDDGTYYIVTGYGVNLSTVTTIPEEYEGKPVKEIKAEAFDRDALKLQIEEMTLAATIEKIGASAFYGCTNLRAINFKVGLKSIGHGAFTKCSALTEIKLPEGLEVIDDLAFSACVSLAKVTLPASVKSIGANVFSGTKFLNGSAPTHNGNVKYILNTEGKAWVLSGDYDIVDANLPDNAVGIASEAFAYCDTLTTLEIPAGVKYISADAFKGCTALTTINYGGSPTEFGQIVIEGGNEVLNNVTINYAK